MPPVYILQRLFSFVLAHALGKSSYDETGTGHRLVPDSHVGLPCRSCRPVKSLPEPRGVTQCRIGKEDVPMLENGTAPKIGTDKRPTEITSMVSCTLVEFYYTVRLKRARKYSKTEPVLIMK